SLPIVLARQESPNSSQPSASRLRIRSTQVSYSPSRRSRRGGNVRGYSCGDDGCSMLDARFSSSIKYPASHFMKANRHLTLVCVACTFALVALPTAETAQETPKKPVSTKYQGVTVVDPYQWLEKDDEPDVKAWSEAQNQRTRQYLDQLPDRATIEKQLTEWYAKTSPSYSSLVSRPGLLFVMKFQPPKQQPLLVTLASADDLKSEKVVLDPNVLDAKGTTAIDWFVPSLDGRYVAMSLSRGGSEDGPLHFFETATGKALPDTIAHVQYPTAGGSAAWNADGTGVFYTRFPRKG